jgi:hypothetical protein
MRHFVSRKIMQDYLMQCLNLRAVGIVSVLTLPYKILVRPRLNSVKDCYVLGRDADHSPPSSAEVKNE